MVTPPVADTVAPRSILFIGGTGVISTAAAERAVALGHRLTILNRGRSYGTFTRDEISREDVLALMAGGEALEALGDELSALDRPGGGPTDPVPP